MTAKEDMLIPRDKGEEAGPEKKRGWRELPLGGVITEAGNGKAYATGDWRGSLHPVFDAARCTNCMLCWVYCPDAAIVTVDGKVVGIDYDHCKGCGICAAECPARPQAAIRMVDEGEEG
jgi:pyruvate ferredoxin oxidoreductase delta subunit